MADSTTISADLLSFQLEASVTSRKGEEWINHSPMPAPGSAPSGFSWSEGFSAKQTDYWPSTGQILRSGTYGEVSILRRFGEESLCELRAVKRIFRRDWYELKAMAKIYKDKRAREYLVDWLGWYEYQKHLYIVLEYHPCGDLGNFLEKNGKMNELDTITVVVQFLEALAFLQDVLVAHRDLKPDNILITFRGAANPLEDNTSAPDLSSNIMTVKLADFGTSKQALETQLSSVVGTKFYIAPEVEYKTSLFYTHAVDMWSLGVVVYFMLTCQLPLKLDDVYNYSIRRKSFPLKSLKDAGVGQAGCCFIQKLMAPDGNDRPTAADCLLNSCVERPWATEIIQRYDTSRVMKNSVVEDYRPLARYILFNWEATSQLPRSLQTHRTDTIIPLVEKSLFAYAKLGKLPVIAEILLQQKYNLNHLGSAAASIGRFKGGPNSASSHNAELIGGMVLGYMNLDQLADYSPLLIPAETDYRVLISSDCSVVVVLYSDKYISVRRGAVRYTPNPPELDHWWKYEWGLIAFGTNKLPHDERLLGSCLCPSCSETCNSGRPMDSASIVFADVRYQDSTSDSEMAIDLSDSIISMLLSSADAINTSYGTTSWLESFVDFGKQFADTLDEFGYWTWNPNPM